MSDNHTEDGIVPNDDSFVFLSSEALAQSCCTMRGGLPNSAAKILREKFGRVAFLGGSITQMEGWSNLIEKHLRARFPGAELDFIKAGVGGTNSTFGAFRFEADVLPRGAVDLLFLEFAANDASDYSLANQRLQAMEGILRQARRTNPAMDILGLYVADERKVQTYRERKEPIVITHHEKIFSYYNIPVVNLAIEITRRLDAGLFTWSEFSKDNCHPLAFGHEQYAGCIREFLDVAWKDASTSPQPHPLPEPFCTDHLEGARMIGTQTAQGWHLVSDWLAESVCNYSGPVDVLTATKPGELLTVTFEGSTIAMHAIAGPDAGVLGISVDDGPNFERDLFDHYCERFHRPIFPVLAHGLPIGRHRVTLRVAELRNALSTGHAARILQFGVA
ncbi:hypothetical protein BH09VER1_BH09VER1_47860 [soil metagenome]